ncbi:trace amine-associated receptor 1-like isoform 2-T2 [Syngnathus typhle]
MCCSQSECNTDALINLESRRMEPELTNIYTNIHPCYVLDNTTYIFTSNPSIICVTLYVFLGLLCVCTICGNLLVIISIIYFKQLHIHTNHLILSLAVADILLGVLVFPLTMSFTIFSCWHHEGLFCKIRDGFDITLSITSILNLFCISMDRYYAVCHPLTYRSKINDQVIDIMIMVSWGLAAMIGIGNTVVGFTRGKCEESCLMDAVIWITVSCIFAFYIPVIIMISVYLRIFLVAQKQVRSIQSTACTMSGSIVSKRERKATKTLATVMGVFILCWAPFFIYVISQPLIYNVTQIAVRETLNWIALLNSLLNPLIYAIFYSRFRTAYRLIITGKIFQGDFTNTQLF